MKYFISVFLIILGFVFYRFYHPYLSYESSGDLSNKELECGKRLAHVILDNPIEKIPINKVVISKTENRQIYVQVYFFGGIPYRAFQIGENCNSTRRL